MQQGPTLDRPELGRHGSGDDARLRSLTQMRHDPADHDCCRGRHHVAEDLLHKIAHGGIASLRLLLRFEERH